MRLTRTRIAALAAGLVAVVAALGELIHRDGIEAGLVGAIFAITALAMLLLALLAALLVQALREPVPAARDRRKRRRRKKRRQVEIRTGRPAE